MKRIRRQKRKTWGASRMTEKRKMEQTSHTICADSALQILEELLGILPEYLPPQLELLDMDIRFLEMFFGGLEYWEESDDDWHLQFVMGTMERILRQTAEEFKVPPQQAQGEIMNWEKMSCDLQKKIKELKQHAREVCFLLLGGAYKCKLCQCDKKCFLEYGTKTASFINFVQENLESLDSKIHPTAPVKQQIDFISRKLMMFGKFADLGIAHRTSRVKKISGKRKVFEKFAELGIAHGMTRVKNWGELMSRTRSWVNHISCLVCLYWIEGMDENFASTLGTMFSGLMHKTMPYSPEVIASYLNALQAARYHNIEDTVISQLLASYVDFLLEDLVIPANDDVEILRESLIFLLSFFMVQPMENPKDSEVLSHDGKHILAQIDAIISEVPSLIGSIHVDEMKEGISEIKLSNFLQKMERVKAEVRKLYLMTPSQFNSPDTNAIGFLDSFLRKLKKMLEGKVNFIASVKHSIQTVWEELASLRPFLQNNMELQNEKEELKALRTRIINVVYYAAYVTNLCPAQSFSIWYGILCLPSVIEEIKLIKTEVKEIKDLQMYKHKILNAKMESSNALPPQATTSKIEGAFVGFEEDVRSIIDHLERGQKDLTIVSISGMPGQGKTTLAKRIYNDPSILYHFHKMVWCYVSKECKIRDLMIHIVNDVSKVDVENVSQLEIQDLAERLRKSLKGKRYLIVMDDIWDVGVWRQVQGSFPNDKNGSRILFTSRNHDLASQANSKSISHQLPLFSEKESLDLMKEKLFHYDSWPLQFLEIGKKITTYCKGLPLAVALIASLLGRIARKLDLWNQVAENLKSHLASEGCMHIIELSYKYLPDHLKSCFLYFGAFPRGESIRTKKLKLLWIAEGFIEENEMRSSEDLAEEYLDNLVFQRLVVVTERSSFGGTKRCSVHDLLYDLCIEKTAEENFLYWTDARTVFYGCLQEYNHHRLCIGEGDSLMKPRPLDSRKELPTSEVHSLLLFRDNKYQPRWGPLHESFSQVCKSFKILTVLDLENVRLRFNGFPEVILSNIHLRYLALSNVFKHIPPSIADLWNLETLIMRGFKPLKDPLPETMWKMESLKRVDIYGCRLYLENFEDNNNNSHVALHNIETLGGPIVLPDDPQTAEFLRKLPKLRKLDCSCEDNEWPPTWLSMFGFLKNLETLKIQNAYFPGSTRVATFNFPQSLKKLTLKFVELPWSAMSTIGKQLPNLEVLKLLWDACWGSRWDLEGVEFSKLRFLKLSNLEIEQIDVSLGCGTSFPCLEELVVEHCDRLEQIPSSFGDICSLNTIKVIDCSTKALDSARQILEQQREMGNHSLQVFVC